MLILPQNPSTVLLQVQTGLNISTVSVTVSGVESGSVLSTTDLSSAGNGLFSYSWSPTSLAPDLYTASYTLTDQGGNLYYALEDIIIPSDLVTARQGVTNKFVRSASASTATLYDDDGATVKAQLNLFAQDGLTPAGTGTAFSRVPT